MFKMVAGYRLYVTRPTGDTSSTTSERRTHNELFSYWEREWTGVLEGIEKEGDLAEELKNQFSLGGSEVSIAGDYQGREVVELLQNARDAIRDEDEAKGSVYVGVCEDGLVVANTGAPFDFYTKKVERAVTGVGKSAKSDSESIGEYGIGLKSVLSSGDSFEVWTNAVDAAAEEHTLRIRFSRSYLADGVLDRKGVTDSPDLASGLLGLDDCLSRTDSEGSTTADIDEALSDNEQQELLKTPLFTYPMPLPPSEPEGQAGRLANYLVTGRSAMSGDSFELSEYADITAGEFTTAVIVSFEDQEWRNIIDALETDTEGATRPATRPDTVWRRLVGDGSHQGITPETLVQLEALEEVTFDPVFARESNESVSQQSGRESTDNPSRRLFQITDCEGPVDSGTLSHDRVSIEKRESPVGKENVEQELIQVVYDKFHLPSSEHGVTILVKRTVDGDVVETQPTYPPYLYYPVEGMETNLPFCLHGHFQVTPNRQRFYDADIETNKAVFQEAIHLLGRVAEHTAQIDTEPADGLYPWVLLPPIPDETALDALRGGASPLESTRTLLAWFTDEVYRKLGQTESLPLLNLELGAPADSGTLLYWAQSVTGGIEGLFDLYRTVADKHSGVGGSELPAAPPTKNRLQGLSRLRGLSAFDMTVRLRYLLIDASTADFSTSPSSELSESLRDRTADNWAHLLNAALHRKRFNDSTDQYKRVPKSAARDVLRATAALFAPEKRSRDDISSALGTHDDRLDGVYLLPCTATDTLRDKKVNLEDADSDTVLLAYVENQTQRAAGEGMSTLSRTVLWNVQSVEVELVPPPVDAGFTVYFFDETVEVYDGVSRLLEAVGRLWGVRNHDSDNQQYYRSLLDSFTREKKPITPEALSFLARYAPEFNQSDLSATEGAFADGDLIAGVLPSKSSTRRSQVRRRIRLRSANLQLGEHTYPIRSTQFTRPWRELRDSEDASVNSDPDEIVTSEKTLPEPSAKIWDSGGQIDRQNLARTLGVLGVSSLPNVQVLWLHGDAHPDVDRAAFHWNPETWSIPDNTVVGDLRSSLIDRLSDEDSESKRETDTQSEYLQHLLAPENHPVKSGDHTSKYCDGMLDEEGESEGSKLASWVWFDGDIPDEEELVSVLQRYGEELTNSLLQTGWTCNRHHKYRKWTSPVPTLLNWQLRTVPEWPSLVTPPTEETVRDGWGADGQCLRWAVQASGRERANRLLPTIDPDETELSTSVLSALGVKPIDELAPSGAADRLQKLQQILQETQELDDTDGLEAVTSHTESKYNVSASPFKLRIPNGIENDWRNVYTELCQPILQHLRSHDPESPVPSILESPLLTHLPVQFRDELIATPIDSIQRDDDVRYLVELSPTPWVTKRVQENKYRLLEQPRKGRVKALTDALGLDPVETDLPLINSGDVTAIDPNRTASLRDDVLNRLPYLVAALERERDDQIETAIEDLRSATEALIIVDGISQSQEELLYDNRSRLYKSRESQVGLLLNDTALSGSTDGSEDSRAGLAMAIALLFERPAKADVLEKALRREPGDKLDAEWRDRGFPLQQVLAVMGSQAARQLKKRLKILDSLCEATGNDSPQLASRAREAVSNEAIDLGTASRLFETGDSEIIEGALPPMSAESLTDTMAAYRRCIPKSLYPVATRLLNRGSASYSWWVDICRSIESAENVEADRLVKQIINWIVDNPEYVSSPILTPARKSKLTRVVAVSMECEYQDEADWASPDDLVPVLDNLALDAVPWEDNDGLVLIGEQDEGHSRWFYVIGSEQFESAIQTPLIERFEEASDDQEGTSTILRRFIETGELPSEEESRSSAATKQKRAFESAQMQVAEIGDLPISKITEPGKSSATPRVRTPGNQESKGGSGGSADYGPRGQQAEVAMLVWCLKRLQGWLGSATSPEVGTSSQERMRAFERAFENLYKQQSSQGGPRYYKWHTYNKWENRLLQALDTGFDAKQYQNPLAAGKTLENLQVIPLLNVTQEQGPGFDVIDPFGPLASQRDKNARLEPLPVEIKAVQPNRSEYQFRLTTNELRRCRAFINAGQPYALRVVSVPDEEETHWLSQCELVSETIIDGENIHPDDLLPDGEEVHFSELVRGGYVTLQS